MGSFAGEVVSLHSIGTHGTDTKANAIRPVCEAVNNGIIGHLT